MRRNVKQESYGGKRNSRSYLMLMACGLLLAGGMTQSCEKDILTGQPEYLGNSIYERLQDGITVSDGSVKTFATTLRLIDDLGYTETLSKTGSRTIFATPDDVFEAWFKEKGITYDQLGESQKKALFNNSVINNAYLLELMSNVSGNPPVEAMAMRRETAATIYDSISTYKVEDMPVNPFDDPTRDAWAYRRSTGKDVKMFRDATSAPMIHFLPKFMAKNQITGDDLSVITNGESNTTDDSWINGRKVISTEQTCKNGYIYVIDGVVEGTKSMAEIINSDPQTSLWASFINRWSCPYPVTGAALREYQALNNTEDSVFNLRYFNSGSTHRLLTVPNSQEGGSFSDNEVLLFDPGWNQYMYSSTERPDMHYDAGMMIVPTDEALNEWWNNGAGKSLQQMYGSWDKIPYGILQPLINVNMKESFIETVPSKFTSVLNDAQTPLGIERDNVVKSYMGCNGVVYLVNRVFAPVTYSSVISPALYRRYGAFQIMYNVITGTYPTTAGTLTTMDYKVAYDFTAYLNALDSRFSLILPANSTDGRLTDSKVIRYVDPASYGLDNQTIFEFFVNDKGVVETWAYVATKQEDGSYLPADNTTYKVSDAVVQNRLYDLLDNSILLEDITSDQEYYQTKAGSTLRAKQGAQGMTFQGGYQLDNDYTITSPTDYTYSMGEGGNGTTYGVATDMSDPDQFINIPLTATHSVYETLKAQADNGGDHLFLDLLEKDPTTGKNKLLVRTDGSGNAQQKCTNPDRNYNISVFDSYNYTVYVPTDQAIQKLIDDESLPTWNDYSTTSDDSLKTVIADRIHNFLRYHIQDRAVCIGGEAQSNQKFESAMLNPANNRFFTFEVNADNSSYTVKDQLGNVRNVVTSGGMYNKICREYWLSGMPATLRSTSTTAGTTIESSSNAVVHQIDGVLFYSSDQLKKWNE